MVVLPVAVGPTVTPVHEPAALAPITALVSVTVVEPAVRAAAKVSVTVVVAAVAGVTAVEPHVPAGVGVTTAVVMKPGGIVMTTVSPGTRLVAVVKPTTILPVAPGMRVAGAKVTPET